MTSKPAVANAPAIETDGLVKRYGSTVALAGLSMVVPRGQVFGFLGPNGAGKTTAVKLLLGLARPTSGTGRLLGAPLGDRIARRQVGYLPELFRYQAWLTARDVLWLHAQLAGVPLSARPAAIAESLGSVDLADRAGSRVGTFSKGMQQRLGLAVALLGRPPVVILDEPTSALDPIGRLDVRAIIRRLRAEGTTVFLNSHLLGEVERVCDVVAIVDRGRVVADGPLDELLAVATVRIRVTGLSPAARAGFSAFGTPADEPPWLVVRGCPPERVPDLVAAIVAQGGRIYGVDAGRETLEERFVELLARSAHPDQGA
ncbi:MAG TPA: ABC transporter ATP-binding protein [Candidatus Limnocylindria bacterium]|nr:ABC transporter ATP-binding protein [Candidatus Limnocylindria bacterium]